MSVSLLAVAAIAAGLLVSKRQDRPPAAGELQPTLRSLDAIRAAGL